jgi:hypothetical protein
MSTNVHIKLEECSCYQLILGGMMYSHRFMLFLMVQCLNTKIITASHELLTNIIIVEQKIITSIFQLSALLSEHACFRTPAHPCVYICKPTPTAGTAVRASLPECS